MLYSERLADDDRAVAPRSAFGRFYRFMSASSEKPETFPEGFDMRAFKVRRILIILGLVLFFGGIWAFTNSPKVTDTSRAQIGVLIFLLLPLIVPIFALLGTRLVMYSSRFTGRPALAFAIAYDIVYAAFLISAPIRPLPLDPPLPELMAKIHPCLLDENGNVRAPKTIVVDGVRTVDDVMNVVTNSGRPEFQVAAAFLAFQDRFAKTSDALVDFERFAKTNIVEKADLEAFPEIGQRIAELERLLEIAAVAQGPQFGPGDVVPAFASSRRDYVWRDRSESLPESCYAPLWAARDERDLVHAVSLVQHASDAFF